MSKKTIAIISLGCFRNTYDSEVMVNNFVAKGFHLNLATTKADVLLVNTCGFIDKAKEESIEVIRKAISLKKQGVVKEIVVFGCLVKRYRQELEKAFPEVDNWEGVNESVQTFQKRTILTPPFIGFLKIAEGCNNACSYCAIPLIKGTLKSKPRQQVLEEVQWLDQQGVCELNIIGQDTTSWGKDLGTARNSFAALLQDICNVAKHIRWIRILYLHPQHITDELLAVIQQQERICKYIDLPLQHINDRILGLMNRSITQKEIRTLIHNIRLSIPDAVIRTSFIVGFPTETEKEFEELVHFVEDTRFERLGAFTYSREEQTRAYQLSPQVHYRTKQRRYRMLMETQRCIAAESNQRFIGTEMEVLVESQEHDVFVGRTQYDGYDVDGVVYIKRKQLSLGSLYRAKIVDVIDYDLIAV